MQHFHKGINAVAISQLSLTVILYGNGNDFDGCSNKLNQV